MMQRSTSAVSVPFFIVAALLVPAALFLGQDLPAGSTVPQVVGRVLVILYSSLRLAQLFARAEPRWFALFFWAFTYVWLGLAATTQMVAGTDPFKHAIDPDVDFRSAAFVLVGLVAWDVAYAISFRERFEGGNPRPGRLTARVVSPTLASAVIVTFVLATLFLLQRQGGLTAYLRTRSEVSEALTSGVGADGSLAAVGLVQAATQVPAFVALLCWVLIWRFHPEIRRRPWWWALGAATLATNVLVNNPLGSSRFWFATVAMGVILALPQLTRPRVIRMFIASLVASLAVVFPYADFFRSPEYKVQQQGIAQFMSGKLDYDAAAQITNGIRLVDDRGSVAGEQLMGVIGFLVPRSQWEGKPHPTGELIAAYTGFDFTNLSAPLWVEGYINYGVLGLVAFLALAGAFAGFADRRIRWGANAGTLAVIFFPPLAVYSMILLRGSLQGTIAQGLALTGALIALGLLSRRPQFAPNRSHVGAPTRLARR